MPIGNTTTLPVATADDVLGAAPECLHPDSPAPVRDAIFAGLLAMLLECQDAAGYAAAQSDPGRATGVYEDECGFERGAFRNGQDDDDYRARYLSVPAVVTPTAILAAANAVLAPFTGVTAVYCENQPDRAFAYFRSDALTPPRAYAYFRGSVPRSPDYYDRRYVSEAAQNGGDFRPGREPGASRAFFDRIGRYFLLRVPDLSSVDSLGASVYQESQAADFYVGTSAPGSFTSYIPSGAFTSSGLYAAIVNAVAAIRGQSMRWQMLVDPNLGT